jgi:branched-chain amino acid transport system substrate-binding protein
MRKAQLIAGLAAVLATSFTLAACGGQSSSDDSGSTGSSSSGASTGASTSGATEAKETGPIKMGVTIEKTGPVPVLGTAAIGMQKAADYINANGGVDGRQIELDIQDNAGDPSKAVSQLRQFIDSGYDVVLGGAFGINCAAESAVAAKADVIVFCISTDNLPEDDSHMFGIGTGYDVTIDHYAEVLSQQAKTVAVFADKVKSGDDSARQAPADLEKRGVKVLLERTDPNASTYKPGIQKAIADGAEAIWFTQCTPTVISAVGDAQALGFKGKIMLENCLASLDVAKAVKGFAAKDPEQIEILAPSMFVPDESANPDQKAANDLFLQEMGQPDTVKGAGWDGVFLAKKAIEDNGGTDPASLLQTLENNFQFEGVWQGGTYTAEDHRGNDGDGYLVPVYFTPDGDFAPQK